MTEKITMTELAAAASGPSNALLELLFALIGHLHDRGVIDNNEMIRMLESRVAELRTSDIEDIRTDLVPAYIDWLKRLGTGQAAQKPPVH